MVISTCLGRTAELCEDGRVLYGGGVCRLEWMDADPYVYQWYLDRAGRSPDPVLVLPVDLLPLSEEGFGILFPEMDEDFLPLDEIIGPGLIREPSRLLIETGMKICRYMYRLQEWFEDGEASIRNIFLRKRDGNLRIRLCPAGEWSVEEWMLYLFCGNGEEPDEEDAFSAFPLRDYRPRGEAVTDPCVWFSYLAHLQAGFIQCPGCGEVYYTDEADPCPKCGCIPGGMILETEEMKIWVTRDMTLYGGNFPSMKRGERAFMPVGRSVFLPEPCLENCGGMIWECLTPLGRSIRVGYGGQILLTDKLIFYAVIEDLEGIRERIRIRKAAGKIPESEVVDLSVYGPEKEKRSPKQRLFFLGILLVLLLYGWILYSGEIPLLSPGRQEAYVREAGTAEEIPAGDTLHFYRDALDEEGRAVYDRIEAGILKQDKILLQDSISQETILQGYRAVCRDHPEFYAVDTGWFPRLYTTPEEGILLLEPVYYELDAETCQVIEERMEQAAASLRLAFLPEDTDFQKAEKIYRYVIDFCEYGDSDYSQSLLSVFGMGRSVCSGYAKAFQYLCRELEIPCIWVEGPITEEDGRHAWNKVYLEGGWYLMDCTWGDQGEAKRREDPDLYEAKLYDYFCPLPELYESRVMEDTGYEGIACTDREPLISSEKRIVTDRYDRRRLESTLVYGYMGEEEVPGNRERVKIVFTDSEAYAEAKRMLVQKKGFKRLAKRCIFRRSLVKGRYEAEAFDAMQTICIYRCIETGGKN